MNKFEKDVRLGLFAGVGLNLVIGILALLDVIPTLLAIALVIFTTGCIMATFIFIEDDE